MTFHERLAALGVDLSDLPQNHFGLIGRVANLVDIIDRMETALENVIGERDWLAAYYEDNELMPWYGVPEDWRADDDP